VALETRPRGQGFDILGPMLATLAIILALATTSTKLVKAGSCPSGYVQSSADCAPMANAKPAIPKVGPCPTNRMQSGYYCLKMH